MLRKNFLGLGFQRLLKYFNEASRKGARGQHMSIFLGHPAYAGFGQPKANGQNSFYV